VTIVISIYESLTKKSDCLGDGKKSLKKKCGEGFLGVDNKALQGVDDVCGVGALAPDGDLHLHRSDCSASYTKAPIRRSRLCGKKDQRSLHRHCQIAKC